mmetsp:Transcript_16926/g.55394  ORF Transcript_16926/g.55394 Transcript_16926/m.55394 type:complete len:402 (-) Transcript_16926:1576-2781(-)
MARSDRLPRLSQPRHSRVVVGGARQVCDGRGGTRRRVDRHERAEQLLQRSRGVLRARARRAVPGRAADAVLPHVRAGAAGDGAALRRQQRRAVRPALGQDARDVGYAPRLRRAPLRRAQPLRPVRGGRNAPSARGAPADEAPLHSHAQLLPRERRPRRALDRRQRRIVGRPQVVHPRRAQQQPRLDSTSGLGHLRVHPRHDRGAVHALGPGWELLPLFSQPRRHPEQTAGVLSVGERHRRRQGFAGAAVPPPSIPVHAPPHCARRRRYGGSPARVRVPRERGCCCRRREAVHARRCATRVAGARPGRELRPRRPPRERDVVGAPEPRACGTHGRSHLRGAAHGRAARAPPLRLRRRGAGALAHHRSRARVTLLAPRRLQPRRTRRRRRRRGGSRETLPRRR